MPDTAPSETLNADGQPSNGGDGLVAPQCSGEASGKVAIILASLKPLFAFLILPLFTHFLVFYPMSQFCRH